MKENEDDNSKGKQNGHEHREEQSNESSVFNREMYREEFVDDFDFFRKRFKEMGCDICDLDDLPTEFLVDGCHFSHDGNVEVAMRFCEAIYKAKR